MALREMLELSDHCRVGRRRLCARFLLVSARARDELLKAAGMLLMLGGERAASGLGRVLALRGEAGGEIGELRARKHA